VWAKALARSAPGQPLRSARIRRNPGAADPVRQVAEDQAPCHKGDAHNGKSEPGLAPPMLCKEQNDERCDRPETDTAERQAEIRHPDGTDHPSECRAGAD